MDYGDQNPRNKQLGKKLCLKKWRTRGRGPSIPGLFSQRKLKKEEWCMWEEVTH